LDSYYFYDGNANLIQIKREAENGKQTAVDIYYDGLKRVIKQRISLLLKLMGLENAGNKRIIELSGGMAKRADLIVALIHDPKVLILDEPFAGLDIALVNFLWKTIKYLAEQGRIIIVSSHSLYVYLFHAK